MKFIVDINILFTFFWKNSIFHTICERENIRLFSPVYALEEIEKYESEIIKKAKLTKKEFQRLKEDLAMTINFMYEDEYALFLKSASMLTKELPKEKEVSHFLLFVL